MGVKEHPINCLLDQRKIAHLGKEIFLRVVCIYSCCIRNGCSVKYYAVQVVIQL